MSLFPVAKVERRIPPSLFYILIATIPTMQQACFGLRWYDKSCMKRLKIYSASSTKHFYTMLTIYHPTANDHLYEVQQGFIAAELVLTLRFLLQGTRGFVTYKNFHSKPHDFKYQPLRCASGGARSQDESFSGTHACVTYVSRKMLFWRSLGRNRAPMTFK